MSEHQPSFVLKKAGDLLIKKKSQGNFSFCILPIKYECWWSLKGKMQSSIMTLWKDDSRAYCLSSYCFSKCCFAPFHVCVYTSKRLFWQDSLLSKGNKRYSNGRNCNHSCWWINGYSGQCFKAWMNTMFSWNYGDEMKIGRMYYFPLSCTRSTSCSHHAFYTLKS